MIKTIGSVCSGIEGATIALKEFGLDTLWTSEISSFQTKLLDVRHSSIKNMGDMTKIDTMINNNEIPYVDMICGGTPCQAFSFAGWKNGLTDERGNLTLKFVDIVEANDRERAKNGLKPGIVLWENVEGVLSDKTNAFGCLISALAGVDDVINIKKYSKSGFVKGEKRNVAWRVLDAKYFGTPQQRKRVFLLAGGKDFFPENVLFEKYEKELECYPNTQLTFEKDGHIFEVFREYTDCLFSAYGTKWNGNASAYNGSLFVLQDGRLRRFSPLECERLMGFPDGYTSIDGCKKTLQYQALGNSWAIPVVKWIGHRLLMTNHESSIVKSTEQILLVNGVVELDGEKFNCSSIPNNCKFTDMSNIVEVNEDEGLYLSPVGCAGILRRKVERGLNMNARLEEVMKQRASEMSREDIEKKSRVQKRGRFAQ